MPRVYSDLIDSGGRRYYYHLESAPGGVQAAAPAVITIFGRQATIQELTEVFRTPATALLTLFGRAAVPQEIALPAQAALALQGRQPTLLLQVVITNALPPDYAVLPDNNPTIIYVATIQPTTGLLAIASLEHNVSPGGNIGFLSPGVGAIVLQGRAANFPREVGVASLQIVGLAPSLESVNTITPQVGEITLAGLAAIFATPFIWIDDDPVQPTTWVDDS